MRTGEMLKARLESQDVITAGWPGYVGYVPDDSAQVIGIIPSGGFPQDTHGGENLLESFQVFVRSDSFAVTDAKWLAMFNALQDADLSGGGSTIYLLQALASGALHWLDSRNRHCMSANFRVVRSRS